MVPYSTIEDAVAAVAEAGGMRVFQDTYRFVALLSDYAPNLAREQKDVRAFARAGGFQAVLENHPQERPLDAFVAACRIIAGAFDDAQRRDAMLSVAKSLLERVFHADLSRVDAQALHTAGMDFYRRHPREENIPVALLLLDEAGKRGHADSFWYISAAYLKGKGVAPDPKRGMRALELAAEQGSARAGIALAQHLREGTVTEKDLPRAKKILRSIADPNAAYELAEILHQEGEYKQAAEQYVHAAEMGHVYAQYAAALAYATGSGVPKNLNEGKKWLRSAAAQGHAEAKKKLAELGEG